jgi:hypothetical protein
VPVRFNEPFSDGMVVVVAMSNHPLCIASLKESAITGAVIEIRRAGGDLESVPTEIVGLLNWIAIGARRNG